MLLLRAVRAKAVDFAVTGNIEVAVAVLRRVLGIEPFLPADNLCQINLLKEIAAHVILIGGKGFLIVHFRIAFVNDRLLHRLFGAASLRCLRLTCGFVHGGFRGLIGVLVNGCFLRLACCLFYWCFVASSFLCGRFFAIRIEGSCRVILVAGEYIAVNDGPVAASIGAYSNRLEVLAAGIGAFQFLHRNLCHLTCGRIGSIELRP